MSLNNIPTRDPHHRTIKSFVLRQGRLTRAQQHALENYWQVYGIDYTEQTISLDELFRNNNEVVIEIGFGNGDSLLQQAIDQPQLNFIGIEVHAPGVGHLIHHAQKNAVQNLKVIRHDAVEVLKHQLADDSVNRFQLYFPDPWQKKRHHKRRIMNPEFIHLIQQKLKTGGIFHMATDWQDYADQMLEQMEQAEGFINTSGSGSFCSSTTERYETKFERRGIKLGHRVWDLIYSKT